MIVTGVVLGNIADYFQLPVSSMSNTFTFLNSGILAAIFLNAWLMEIIPSKRQLMFSFLLMVLMVLMVLGSMSGHNLTVFSLSMFVLGMVSMHYHVHRHLPHHPGWDSTLFKNRTATDF